MVGGHESHQFLAGMLAGGTIRLEMHEIGAGARVLRTRRWARTSTARSG